MIELIDDNYQDNYSDTAKVGDEEEIVEHAASNEKGWLVLTNVEAAWGDFPDLEAFLVSNDIGYDKLCDGKYEFPATLTTFRPGWEVAIDEDTLPNHEPTVGQGRLREVYALFERGRVEEFLARFKQLLGNDTPELTPFRIVEDQHGDGDRAGAVQLPEGVV